MIDLPTITIDSDEPVIVLSLSEYEALLETIEILSEYSSILKELDQTREDIANGRGISLSDFLKIRKQ